jgi:nucleotide-binding universal stress UspA family protein
VDVAGREAGAAFTAQFQELQQLTPAAEILTPSRPGSAGYAVTTAGDVASAINTVATLRLPDTLAGRTRRPTPPGTPAVIGLGAYGDGLSVFAVAAIPGRLATQTLQKIREGGGVPVVVSNGGVNSAEAYEVHTALVNALIVRTSGTGRRRTYLLAGSVSAEVLRQAGAELLTVPQVRP